MVVDKIKELKSILDSEPPLNISVLRRLRENYIIKNTYNSNAIEGSTLTEMETRVIIETGITVAKKTLREHLEVKNHVEALEYLEELKNNKLSEMDIKSIHSIILSSIDRENAGKYRNVNVEIQGASHKCTDAIKIKEEMNELLKWYSESEVTLERIVKFTCKFINIHPFIDGNGRTSRLLTNLELLKLGYPPVTILLEDRLDYYKALDSSYYEKYQEAEEFYYTLILKTLEEYLEYTNREFFF